MCFFTHLLLLSSLCGVVVVAQKLEDLSNLDKCNLCRSFAEALLQALDRDLLPNDVQPWTVSRCELELDREGKQSLASYCSAFNDDHYNSLLHQAQMGLASSEMCEILCHSLTSSLQGYDNDNQPHRSWAQTTDTDVSQAGSECEKCKRVLQNLQQLRSLFGIPSKTGDQAEDHGCDTVCKPPTANPGNPLSQLVARIMDQLAATWYEKKQQKEVADHER